MPDAPPRPITEPDTDNTLFIERARLAGVTARHGANSNRAAIARRDYRAAALAEHIRRVNDEAPPLSAAQRDKLATLLRPVGESA